MMFRWKTTAALPAAALTLIAALAMTGCTADTSTGGDGGGTLKLGAIAAPSTFDPAGAEWGNRAPYYQAVFDTLLLATPEGDIAPFLATDWSYNEDNTELTLTLRDDVTFSDGTPLTAEAVKQNLERFRDGTSPDASYLASLTAVDTPDDTTVVLTLSAPNPALLDYLTRDAGLIGSPTNFDHPESATTPIGSGPYTLDADATVTGTTYAFTKNPDYWNPEVQHYDGVVISVYTDPTAALNAIKSGEANGVKLANNDNLAEVEGSGWTVNAADLNFHGLLLLDRAGTINPALADVRVRQAINYAFDRPALLTALQGDKGTVTTQVFPERSAGFDAELDDRYPYDPERAKELLAEAGYADGLTISMPSTAALGTTTYTLLSQQLAAIGVTAEYSDPGTNFIADLLAPKFPASFMSLEQTGDWQLAEFMIAPNAIFNPFGFEDPKVDEILTRLQTGDTEQQGSAAAELNEYLVEQAWFAPWYRVQNTFASDPGTVVEMMPTNAYPSLYDIRPAS